MPTRFKAYRRVPARRSGSQSTPAGLRSWRRASCSWERPSGSSPRLMHQSGRGSGARACRSQPVSPSDGDTMTATDRRAKIKSVFIVSSGNFLEMYDFMVFGYYATAIARTFFPGSSEYASLMLSLMTFGAGFLMRPLGAIFLGAYLDRHGRRSGLLLTLGLMAVGTLTIAFMPGFESIGLLAPVLILVGRLLQGLSAGVEVGGVSVYLSEIATPGRKGFYVSWQSASQQVAVVVAALLGVVLSENLPPEEMARWGWRVPLVAGCAIIPFLFVI